MMMLVGSSKDTKAMAVSGSGDGRGRGDREYERVSADFASRLGSLEGRIELLIDRIDDLVTKARFYPVELIAYGLVGGVLITVLGAVLLRVIVK